MRKILPDLCLLTAMPLLIYSVHRVFLETPIERQMGTAFKIFFFHVPMGWLCMLMAVVCGVAAGIELSRRSPLASAVAPSVDQLCYVASAARILDALERDIATASTQAPA